jgi:hypothetical protein
MICNLNNIDNVVNSAGAQKKHVFLSKNLSILQYLSKDRSLFEILHIFTCRILQLVVVTGPTGKNNSLLVIESAGRIDLDGLLKSVQLTPFLIQRYKFQERMLKLINDREQRYGTQSSVVYILDLDGLKLDSSLINIVTGKTVSNHTVFGHM